MRVIQAFAALAVVSSALKVGSETETEVLAQVKSATEAKTEATAEAKTEVKTEVKTEAKTEAKTETKTEAKTEATAEASTETEAEQQGPPQPQPTGWAGPIVPEIYGQAVKEFDLTTPFTNQDEYKKQLDIYSDQIIAIEALRMEIIKLDYSITQAEEDYTNNARRILTNADRIMENHQSALNNKANIEKLQMDVNDVGNCLTRQFEEQATLRSVLELYCHQFTYVASLPYQCEQILGAATKVLTQ